MGDAGGTLCRLWEAQGYPWTHRLFYCINCNIWAVCGLLGAPFEGALSTNAAPRKPLESKRGDHGRGKTTDGSPRGPTSHPKVARGDHATF